MIEKELKAMLTYKQYLELKSKLDWNCSFVQINFYYDTENRYYWNHGITIRIRKKKDAFFLQAKLPVSIDGGLHIKKEYEKKMLEVSETISAEELFALTGTELPAVKRIGSLMTERAEYAVGNTLVCLDRNEYMDTEDFEIEIEFSSQPDNRVLEMVSALGVDFNQKSLGKFTRFNLLSNLDGECV